MYCQFVNFGKALDRFAYLWRDLSITQLILSDSSLLVFYLIINKHKEKHMENQRWRKGFHKNKYFGLHLPETIIKVKKHIYYYIS